MVKIYFDSDMLKIVSDNYYFEQPFQDFSIKDVIELLESLGHDTSFEEYHYDE